MAGGGVGWGRGRSCKIYSLSKKLHKGDPYTEKRTGIGKVEKREVIKGEGTRRGWELMSHT